MKQLIPFLTSLLLLPNVVRAQYFQGSFSKDQSDAVNLKMVFKMRPTGALTTAISYMEAAFRYPTAATPAFSVTNIASNTATFPGLSFQRFLPDYVSGGYTYVKFVFNTATVSSATYTPGMDYSLFTVTTSLPAGAMPQFDMVSNLVLGQYQFGVVNGAGNLIAPGTGPQLYGPGFTLVGNDHILPLFPSIIPTPVTFSAFKVIRKDATAVLTWAVEGQDGRSSHFEVERSVNGIAFSKIGTVGINLSSGSGATYTFTDANPGLNKSAPRAYYRIKQLDKDGKFIYTEIRSVKPGDKDFGIVLYPSPASQKVWLSFEMDAVETLSINVINANGATLRKIGFMSAKGRNQKEIDVAKFSCGVYNVVISGHGWTEAVKFVKGL